jgi:hypothetical protein
MPYDTYRLYQIQRPKSPCEVQRADEQAARLASAISSLFRGFRRPASHSEAASGRRTQSASSGVTCYT